LRVKLEIRAKKEVKRGEAIQRGNTFYFLVILAKSLGRE